MTSLFIIQLVASFVVGGLVIASFSLLAERLPPKIAGVIICLPSTIAVGYLFMGISASPQVVSDSVPAALFATSGVFLFEIGYLYISKLPLKKYASMTIGITGALCLWLLIAAPTAFFKFSNLGLAVFAYALGLAIAYKLITMRAHKKSTLPPLRYTLRQKIWRAIFGGAVVAAAVYLAKTLGPFWGGIMSAFPALFSSTFLILHKNYDSPFLFKVFKNVPLGSLSYASFLVASHYTFPAFGVTGGLLSAYAAAGIIAFMLLWLPKK